MNPRDPKLAKKIFKDDNGRPFEGTICYTIPDKSLFIGFDTLIMQYKHGRIHGSPAIQYPDGLEEIWEEGEFVGILHPPYKERTY
jgi:hypothetical protein